MSLDWNLKDIKNHLEVCWTAIEGEPPRTDSSSTFHQGLEGGEPDQWWRMNTVTQALIWRTMNVGIGAITEKNLTEFCVRMKYLDRLIGPSISKPNPDGDGFIDIAITPEQIRDHIGLTTNVFPKTTERKFVWGTYEFWRMGARHQVTKALDDEGGG